MNVCLKIGKNFEIFFFVLENLKYSRFFLYTQSVISTPTTISVRHKFEAHFISHSFEIFVHFVIDEEFRIISKTILEHCKHHSSETSNGLSWSFSKEISCSFLEFHFMIWDESLMSGRDINNIFIWTSLFLNTYEYTGDFLWEIIFNKLIDDSHISLKKPKG